jgi:hypothetical protein
VDGHSNAGDCGRGHSSEPAQSSSQVASHLVSRRLAELQRSGDSWTSRLGDTASGVEGASETDDARVRRGLAGLLILVVVLVSACGTGPQAVSANTRSACHEVLSLNEPVLPKAHSASVIMWPPYLFQFLKQSGSPLLEMAANEVPRDELANRGVRETAAWHSAVAYCQSVAG